MFAGRYEQIATDVGLSDSRPIAEFANEVLGLIDGEKFADMFNFDR
jgi:hypothetical protein